MNRHRQPPASASIRATDTAWVLDGTGQSQALPRYRRYRRLFLDTRSDVLLTGLLFLMLIWMAFVALTLWH